MSHCFQFVVIYTKKQRDMSPCLIAISFKLVLTYNTKNLLIPKPWQSGWLELLMFATFVLPNQLCGGGIKVLWTFIAWALNYKSEGEIKLFELLISVLLPISIQISILMLGVQVHVREGFLQFGLSSKQHLWGGYLKQPTCGYLFQHPSLYGYVRQRYHVNQQH